METGSNIVLLRVCPRGSRHLDRRVSCKDLGEGDYQGWLHRKKGKGEGPLVKHWLKRWCVLKEEKLFCYKDREDLKAESAIYLPAFDVCPAPEIKSRK